MSNLIKTPAEISIIRKSGALLARALTEVVSRVAPGISTEELDQVAQSVLVRGGGIPSFKGYAPRNNITPYPSTLCISINDEVVHAPPIPARILQEGDVVGLDIGVRFPAKDGFFTDMAVTVGVGKISKEAQKLIAVTKESLDRVIKIVKPGTRLRDIGKSVQSYIESNGFSVVRDLVGHGVGYAVHEPPEVPNFWEPGLRDMELAAGMVIAIEPMVASGDWKVTVDDDGWTIRTADGSLAAHFEHTLVITETGCDVVTRL